MLTEGTAGLWSMSWTLDVDAANGWFQFHVGVADP